MYAARGTGGQSIVVLPDEGVVIAFTGRISKKNSGFIHHLIKEYIHPAINPIPLPENNFGKDRLARLSLLDSNSISAKQKPKNLLPKKAAEVSGKLYKHKTSYLGKKGYSQLLFNNNSSVAIVKGQPALKDVEYKLVVGLAGEYIINDVQGEKIACKGRWVNAFVFELSYEIIGAAAQGKISYKFNDNKVELKRMDTV